MTTIPGTEFDWHAHELASTCLALTVAAGGKIVCLKSEMTDLTRYRLVVTEDNLTGDKVYEARLDKDTHTEEEGS